MVTAAFHLREAQPPVTLRAVPSVVTAIGLILGGYGLILRNPWLLLASFLLDAADGWLARQLDVVTDFGAQFDRIGDIVLAQAGVWLCLPARPVLSVLLLAAQCGSLVANGAGAPRRFGKWTGRTVLSLAFILSWQNAWL